jgi:hypothetical protein
VTPAGAGHCRVNCIRYASPPDPSLPLLLHSQYRGHGREPASIGMPTDAQYFQSAPACFQLLPPNLRLLLSCMTSALFLVLQFSSRPEPQCAPQPPLGNFSVGTSSEARYGSASPVIEMAMSTNPGVLC